MDIAGLVAAGGGFALAAGDRITEE